MRSTTQTSSKIQNAYSDVINPSTSENQAAILNKIPVSAFGDLRTSELSSIFQGSFEYTVSNTEITETTAVAPATVTQAE